MRACTYRTLKQHRIVFLEGDHLAFQRIAGTIASILDQPGAYGDDKKLSRPSWQYHIYLSGTYWRMDVVRLWNDQWSVLAAPIEPGPHQLPRLTDIQERCWKHQFSQREDGRFEIGFAGTELWINCIQPAAIDSAMLDWLLADIPKTENIKVFIKGHAFKIMYRERFGKGIYGGQEMLLKPLKLGQQRTT